MTEKIEINLQRIEYMMELFDLNKQELLVSINKDAKLLKKPLKEDDIFVRNIKISNLKKIDKIFQKGCHYYTDPKPPSKNKSSSIFFRKDKFNSQLELGDRELVHKMESRIHSLSALCRLSSYQIKRKINEFSTKDNPEEAAQQIRRKFYPQKKTKDDREFLKALIKTFAENNVVVLEFVENWNKKHKTSLNGFFIAPHYIVIKRQQKAFKREIFTLAHELGHYLLDIEEIDNIKFSKEPRLSKVERWCDKFAFSFLTNNEEIDSSFQSINDERLKRLSQEFHISRLALFTHLAATEKITWELYGKLKDDLKKDFERQEEEKKEKKQEKESLEGKSTGRSPKPIFSPLEKDIYTSAYFEGVVDEYRVLSHFKTADLDKLLYGQ